jgi:hypothetical protein
MIHEFQEVTAQLSHFWPNIAIVNTPSSGVSDELASEWTNAVAKQVVNHFGPIWHTYADLNYYPSTAKVPSGMWVVSLLDTSDQAGALGYHDLTPDGFPLGKIFAGTDRQYNQSTSVTLSHEVLEMLGDPYIDSAAQASDGKFYALEVGDAVEGDQYGYLIDGILVSDFVTPFWFGGSRGPSDKFDFMGHTTSPLQLISDGYISVFDPASSQGWTQITAQNFPIQPHQVPKVGSRRERRFRGKANWSRSTYPL